MDGLGPYEKKKLRNAIRQVWHRSRARAICVSRSTDKAGYSVCEKCGKRNPKNKIDHVKQVGEVGPGFIERMFVESKFLQALCKTCHNAKTAMERKVMAAAKKVKEDHMDFY